MSYEKKLYFLDQQNLFSKYMYRIVLLYDVKKSYGKSLLIFQMTLVHVQCINFFLKHAR